jgi:hypothetical protein
MNCNKAQQQISDYLDDLLDEITRESLQTHVKSCAECADKLAEEESFRNQLKGLPVPPASYGFVDRALQNAVKTETKQSHHRVGFVKGFATAVAAGLALWVVLLAPPDKPLLDQDSATNLVQVSLMQPQDVTLAFNAQKDLTGATITISLSDNIHLVGLQGRQTIEWQTDLVKGDNVLKLPIKAINNQKGRLVAQIKHNDMSKSVVIEFDVKKPGVSGVTQSLQGVG